MPPAGRSTRPRSRTQSSPGSPGDKRRERERELAKDVPVNIKTFNQDEAVFAFGIAQEMPATPSLRLNVNLGSSSFSPDADAPVSPLSSKSLPTRSKRRGSLGNDGNNDPLSPKSPSSPATSKSLPAEGRKRRASWCAGDDLSLKEHEQLAAAPEPMIKTDSNASASTTSTEANASPKAPPSPSPTSPPPVTSNMPRQKRRLSCSEALMLTRSIEAIQGRDFDEDSLDDFGEDAPSSPSSVRSPPSRMKRRASWSGTLSGPTHAAIFADGISNDGDISPDSTRARRVNWADMPPPPEAESDPPSPPLPSRIQSQRRCSTGGSESPTVHQGTARPNRRKSAPDIFSPSGGDFLSEDGEFLREVSGGSSVASSGFPRGISGGSDAYLSEYSTASSNNNAMESLRRSALFPAKVLSEKMTPGDDVTQVLKTRMQTRRHSVGSQGDAMSHVSSEMMSLRSEKSLRSEQTLRSEKSLCSLRSAGVSVDQVSPCEALPPKRTWAELWKAWLAAVKDTEEPLSRKEWATVLWKKRFYHIFSILCLLVAFCLIIAASVAAYAASLYGWERGTCRFMAFANQQWCGATCQFQVSIRDHSVGLPTLGNGTLSAFHYDYTFVGFQPEKVRTLTTWEWADDAFRCCGNPVNVGCCSFRDENTRDFCDSWRHREDVSTGLSCPSSGWDCFFKLQTSPSGEKEVTQLLSRQVSNAGSLGLAAGLLIIVSALPWAKTAFKKVANRVSDQGESKASDKGSGDVEAPEPPRRPPASPTQKRRSSIASTSSALSAAAGRHADHPFVVQHPGDAGLLM